MLRLIIVCLAAVLSLSTAAHAQWRYLESGSEANAFVTNADGTQMGLRCTSAPSDRQRMLFDLRVVPLTTDPDDEEVARFNVGTWQFSVEAVPDGRLRNGRQGYLSRLEYMHPVNQRIRDQLKSGNQVRFDQTFDFAAMRFGLRGSRDAITRLEAACPRLWAGRAAPTAGPSRPAVPTSSWVVRNDPPTLTAIVEGVDETYFGLRCLVGRSDQIYWVFQIYNDAGVSGMRDYTIQIDGRPYNFLSMANAEMQMQSGLRPFIIRFSPGQQAGLLADLRDGATTITLPGIQTSRSASFSGRGARNAIDQAAQACGFDPAALPGGPAAASTPAPSGPVAPVSRSVPPEALAGLRRYVVSQAGALCTDADALTVPEGAFVAVNDTVRVQLGDLACRWQVASHPYCVGSRCAVWTYRYTGGEFTLLSTTQE